jgi:D-sedoheptulose 7-phosphate isomerase
MEITQYISTLQNTLDILPVEQIEYLAQTLQEARMAGKRVFIMGNGGSASTASHFVCDLGKNTRMDGWPDFKVIGLTDNMAIFSAYANDEGYDQAFARQLTSLLQDGDVVIGISASGNSPNVLNAIEAAKRHNAQTIGFTGFNGGKLRHMVDINIHIDSNIIEHVEDIHLMLEHMIVLYLKKFVRQQTAPYALAASELFEQPVVVLDESC